ncbi:MAG TPA: hypothetical protein VGE62_02900 [Candidatus Paceibacterota bacterium]
MKNTNGIRQSKTQDGFIELIVVVIIALVLLRVFDIDIKEILAKPWVKDFGAYVVSLLKLVWADFLEIVAFIKGLLA